MTVCPVCASTQNQLIPHDKYHYCRCKTCGVTSCDPLPTDEEISAHYAKQFASGNYGFSRQYENQLELVYTDYVKLLKKRLDFASSPAILDVGCWTGGLLGLLKTAGADIYGVELQPEAVAIASERFPNRVLQADVHGEAFPEQTFDAITATGLIEHVLDPIKLLRTFAARLSAGGILLIETPNTDSILCRLMGQNWPPYAPVEHLHLFSARGLSQALTACGFEDIRVYPHWKQLSIDYVYYQLQSFGPALRKPLAPLYKILPKSLLRVPIPLYVGEMIVTARRCA